jgi:hypothetical protein
VLFAGTPAVPTAGSGGGPLFMAWNSLGLTVPPQDDSIVAAAGRAAFPGL